MRPRLSFLALLIGAAVGSAAAAAPAAAARPGAAGFDLAWPLACEPGRTCWVQNYFDDDPGPGALDYRCGHMTYDGHDAVDIRLASLAAMRRGVPVLAAAAGVVKATRDGVVDASLRDAANPRDPTQACGNAVVVVSPGGWQTMYCHMRQGSIRVKSGEQVKVGQALGLVGLSGQTEFPHLHLGVRQGARKVDPFAPAAVPGRCGGSAGPTLWRSAVGAQLAYRSPQLINRGFSGGSVTEAQIDSEQPTPPAKGAPLVVYVRAIGLEAGDVEQLTLSGPTGQIVAAPPRTFERPKATAFRFVGKKPPAQGWPSGAYKAHYEVRRGGRIVLTGDWTHGL